MCEKRNEQCQFVYFDDMLRKYGNIFQHRKNVNNVMIFWNGGIPPGGPAYKRHKKDNENNENTDDNNNNIIIIVMCRNGGIPRGGPAYKRHGLQKQRSLEVVCNQ